MDGLPPRWMKPPDAPDGTCRWCRKPCKPPKRNWCSKECIHEWQIRGDSSYAQRQVLKRDKGVCSLCGLDCTWERRRVLELWHRRNGWWRTPAGEWRRQDNPAAQHAAQLQLEELARFHRLSVARLLARTHLFEVDHIVPVAEGGGSCPLEGLRTLCRPCHLGETSKLMGRIRARQRDLQDSLVPCNA